MKLCTVTLLFCLLFIGYSALSAAELRQWTGSNGKIIEAEVLGLEGDVVKVKLKNGREMNVLLSKFAKKDQETIRQITSTEDPFVEDLPQEVPEDEMLPFTDFRNNRMPFSDFGKGGLHISDRKPFSFKAGSTTRISNENGVFKIVRGEINDPSKPGSDTWGTFGQIKLAKGKRYCFTVEAKSDKPAKFSISLWGVDPRGMFNTWTPIFLQTQWRKYSVIFNAPHDMESMIAVNLFMPQRTYEIRKISLRPVGMENLVDLAYTDKKVADNEKSNTNLGPELLKVTAFRKGDRLGGKNFDWHWHDKTGSDSQSLATLTTPSDMLKIVCHSAAGPFPQLIYTPISLDKEKMYRIEMEIRGVVD